MLLPLGDHPNPSKPQWVTRILIGINVILYLFVTVPSPATIFLDAIRMVRSTLRR